MKKFNEQERYYARKNRQLDYDEAIESSATYTGKAASELTKRAFELKEVIQRAYQSGVDKGREQGGLEPLFKGEV
ncbi:hypothetical protein RLV03_000391 [Salmonella enterica subsp. enterica serovar Benin]|uniref:Uncharacterized protein n=1 Tax=Salmonella enterica TaxID=28901 RepID=A0A760AAZ5_SALER|nr:hypothetical protein [Salmonella enterica]EIM5532961.1 hypothetical protein [Salmonella enterica subsp. enterica]ELD8107745.1 hypothetical protein [Salmonella enterica subsp. enterica serovar Benin]EFO7518592.1 hypothetical protein [Salmonella enterica]EIE1693580.1 hypothetical protein [Salmonella enterica]